MIISHKHKFIFIKTFKTAGTSVEVFLERYCGDEDVVTPVSPFYKDPEVLSHSARNCSGFYNHISAAEIKSKISESVWNSYFKFTIERNSWDKLVSMYYWMLCKSDFDFTFEEYCAMSKQCGGERFQWPVDYSLYALDGEVAVDYVVQYENLIPDLAFVLKKIGLPFKGMLPQAKTGIRNNVRPYQDYYNDDIKELVARMFHREVEQFNYQFE